MPYLYVLEYKLNFIFVNITVYYVYCMYLYTYNNKISFMIHGVASDFNGSLAQ